MRASIRRVHGVTASAPHRVHSNAARTIPTHGCVGASADTGPYVGRVTSPSATGTSRGVGGA
jgi:hypothetical protein